MEKFKKSFIDAEVWDLSQRFATVGQDPELSDFEKIRQLQMAFAQVLMRLGKIAPDHQTTCEYSARFISAIMREFSNSENMPDAFPELESSGAKSVFERAVESNGKIIARFTDLSPQNRFCHTVKQGNRKLLKEVPPEKSRAFNLAKLIRKNQIMESIGLLENADKLDNLTDLPKINAVSRSLRSLLSVVADSGVRSPELAAVLAKEYEPVVTSYLEKDLPKKLFPDEGQYFMRERASKEIADCCNHLIEHAYG